MAKAKVKFIVAAALITFSAFSAMKLSGSGT